jgi:hypothetical protein
VKSSDLEKKKQLWGFNLLINCKMRNLGKEKLFVVFRGRGLIFVKLIVIGAQGICSTVLQKFTSIYLKTEKSQGDLYGDRG